LKTSDSSVSFSISVSAFQWTVSSCWTNNSE
jgi:hypothetical protein